MDEYCSMCGEQATHKVAEDTKEERHPFTNYVCCMCFGIIMGKVARVWCLSGHDLSNIFEIKTAIRAIGTENISNYKADNKHGN